MKTIKEYITENMDDKYGYNIVFDVEGGKCSQEDLEEIRSIASSYNMEEHDDGDFYCYNTKEYNNFIAEIKKKKLGGRVFLYKGEYPDYEWEDRETLEF